jgi:hypothetical protein
MPVLSFDTRQTISGANTCVNTWHCFVPATPTVAEANAILAPFKAFFDAHVLYRSAGTVPVTGSRVLYWPESAWTKPVIDPVTHKVTTKGYFNTEPLIIGASPATATSGRSGRGRTYLGNISQNAQSGSLITAAFVTAVNAAATTLISAVRALSVGGTPPYLCVWSPTKGTTRETLSGVMDGTFDTMRSRVK